MSDPFIAEIRIFPFDFAPRGWALCDGQVMSISQNTALFSLLGTTYGGDGRTTFALPNLEGRAAMHPGQGPGLSSHDPGEADGSEGVSLLQSEMPAHSHSVQAQAAPGDAAVPAGAVPARVIGATPYLAPAGAPLVSMAPGALGGAGGDQPHNNLQPYLALNFCIALQGIFPPRS
jgi:microcystin-dependent protein